MGLLDGHSGWAVESDRFVLVKDPLLRRMEAAQGRLSVGFEFDRCLAV